MHYQELRAIVPCFDKYSHMLQSCKEVVTVNTDHHNLTYFDTKKFLKSC